MGGVTFVTEKKSVCIALNAECMTSCVTFMLDSIVKYFI